MPTYKSRLRQLTIVPDLLTGEEEIEIAEAIEAYKRAIERLDPQTDAASIASLQEKVDALEQTIEAEIPTALLCPTCNHPDDLPPQRCPTSGHVLGEDGYAIGGKAYLPAGVSA